MSDLAISPEGLDVANEYLSCGGDITKAAENLCIPREKAVQLLHKAEVKRYIDAVYLDTGYRNRNKLGALLDKIIDSKIEEAEESEMYTNKDLADLIQMAHKMRMDEITAQAKHSSTSIKNQTNVQINDTSKFGEGNYGVLMEKLFNGISEEK